MDKTELIAAGQAIRIIPAGEYTSRLRPDLTTVSLKGVERSQVVLATRAGDRNGLVTAFQQLAGPCLGSHQLTASAPRTR